MLISVFNHHIYLQEERALELRQQEAAKAADEMDQMEEDDEDDE